MNVDPDVAVSGSCLINSLHTALKIDPNCPIKTNYWSYCISGFEPRFCFDLFSVAPKAPLKLEDKEIKTTRLFLLTVFKSRVKSSGSYWKLVLSVLQAVPACLLHDCFCISFIAVTLNQVPALFAWMCLCHILLEDAQFPFFSCRWRMLELIAREAKAARSKTALLWPWLSVMLVMASFYWCLEEKFCSFLHSVHF